MWQSHGVLAEEGLSGSIYGLGGMWSSLFQFRVDLEEFRATCYFRGMWGPLSHGRGATCGHFYWRTHGLLYFSVLLILFQFISFCLKFYRHILMSNRLGT